MGLKVKPFHLLAGKGQAEDEDRACPAQFGKGPVVMSAALTQASTVAVEGQERSDYQVRSHFFGVLRRCRQA